ncbi:MAG: TraR/DksA family transcriptional regulator [Candidatus Pacebacteria bacterium]|nr:TraR/DksA family transcriptional regulator [Candidatus Paceibacterota bacterium]MDD4333864.1 TraR/DksA family transcriptional regulator [Candidatus Paceibacterota bacterium]
MFEQEFIEKQKELLMEEKKQLERLLSEFTEKEKGSENNFKTKYTNIDPDEVDPEEAANEVEEFVDLLPQEYTLEIKLKNVNESLEKIEKGTYGICEVCGRAIEEDRLKVNPSAKKCLTCLDL